MERTSKEKGLDYYDLRLKGIDGYLESLLREVCLENPKFYLSLIRQVGEFNQSLESISSMAKHALLIGNFQ